MLLREVRRLALASLTVVVGLLMSGCGAEPDAQPAATTARAGTTITKRTAAVARPAYMPCDKDVKTTLRARPTSCSVFSGSNGVGANTIAEGSRVMDLR